MKREQLKRDGMVLQLRRPHIDKDAAQLTEVPNPHGIRVGARHCND